MILSYKGKQPIIDKDTFIAPNATIIGDVVIEKGASIWYGAVLRGDMDAIRIGPNSNIQDNATVHTDTGVPTIVGTNVTVGHNAILHGCKLENNVLIGIGAIILNQSTVKSGTIIAAGSLVKESQICEPSSLYAGTPCVLKKSLVNSEKELQEHAQKYVHLSQEHQEEKG